MVRQNQRIMHSMLAILRLIAAFIANLFKSRCRLEAENLFLRHYGGGQKNQVRF